MKKAVVIISPHPKKCGETYIFDNLINHSSKTKDDLDIYLYNHFNEFSHIKEKSFLIENKFKINFFSNYFERLSPWLHYRCWMILTSITLITNFKLNFNFLKKKYQKIFFISRMGNSAIALVSFFNLTKNFYFVSSMAGYVKKNFIRYFFWKYLCKNYSFIHIPSKDMYNHTKKLFKYNLITCFPNPVLNDQMLNIKFDFKQYSGVLKLVCVGRLSNQKGFDILIKSLEHFNDFTLDIIGDGEEFESLQNLIQDLKLNSKINLLGSKKSPWNYLHRYNLFIMPSRWEGPGHTVIEAMNVGIPVLVSNCNFGPKETVKNGQIGYVFDLNDNDDLINKLNLIKNNYADAINKSKLALIDVKEKYSTRNFYKNIKQQIDNI